VPAVQPWREPWWILTKSSLLWNACSLIVVKRGHFCCSSCLRGCG
jgi:hypothetical protein